jgi:hypothetical protein
MKVGYGSVTTDDIPTDAQVVFAYKYGTYAQIEAVTAHCPHARLVTVATEDGERADMYDIEHGAMTITGVIDALRLDLDDHVGLRAVYASLDTMPDVRGEIERAGISLADIRPVVAHFTDAPELPAWASAVQWTQTALGRNLNEYLLRDSFFPVAKPKITATQHQAIVTLASDGKWSIDTLDKDA